MPWTLRNPPAKLVPCHRAGSGQKAPEVSQYVIELPKMLLSCNMVVEDAFYEIYFWNEFAQIKQVSNNNAVSITSIWHNRLGVVSLAECDTHRGGKFMRCMTVMRKPHPEQCGCNIDMVCFKTECWYSAQRWNNSSLNWNNGMQNLQIPTNESVRPPH